LSNVLEKNCDQASILKKLEKKKHLYNTNKTLLCSRQRLLPVQHQEYSQGWQPKVNIKKYQVTAEKS